MTRHEKLMAAEMLALLRDTPPDQTVQRLFLLGLVNLKACEQRVLRNEIARFEKQGLPRCEAMRAAAETCCCSYEKARNAFYEPPKF